MKPEDVKVGQTLVNKYGLKFHVTEIVERGIVGTYGADIHKALIEWPQLYLWKQP